MSDDVDPAELATVGMSFDRNQNSPGIEAKCEHEPVKGSNSSPTSPTTMTHSEIKA